MFLLKPKSILINKMNEAENWLKIYKQSQLHNRILITHSSSAPSINSSEFSTDDSLESMVRSKSVSDLIENDKKIIQFCSKSHLIDKNFANIEPRKLSTKNLDKIFCLKRMLADGFAKIEKIFKFNLFLNSSSNKETNTTSTNPKSKLDWTQHKGNYIFNIQIGLCIALKPRYLPKFLLIIIFTNIN